MKTPPYLKNKSRIGICSTAKSITIERMQHTIQALENAGFEVVLGTQTINQSFHQFSASDLDRLKEFQKMLDDDSLDAILFARGGYGTVRILDDLDFTKFKKKPKWLCGFSDITFLHSHINSFTQVPTIHSLMCSTHDVNILPDYPIQSLIQALKGEQNTYSFPISSFNKGETMEGNLIGGNLSILYALNGSVSMYDSKNKILFIEDLTEYKYHIDRMLYNLKRSGLLKSLKGLLVGSFTDILDNDIPFGYTIEELILNAVKDYNFPVIFDFPCGHQGDNRAIKIGMPAKIWKDELTTEMIFIQE